MVALAIPKKLRVRFGPSKADPNNDLQSDPTLGILAFEAARTLLRLISLHRALSDASISTLRSDVMRSDGVAYLTSLDQRFLLRLAAADLVSDLDLAADAISRRNPHFRRVYAELKSGDGCSELALGFGKKEMEKKVRKMERLVDSTSRLGMEMEALRALERKMERWKWESTPAKFDAGLFLEKQRRLVGKIREDSLWERSCREVSDLMARAAVTVLARIAVVFAGIVPELPVVSGERDGRFRFGSGNGFVFHKNKNYLCSSGPIERPAVGLVWVGSSGPILGQPTTTGSDARPWTMEALEPRGHTVGATGLALRYANVIEMAEEMLASPELVGNNSREELYGLLPEGLRAAVRAKLRKCSKILAEDDGMASGWRDATGRILEWLRPMARDTIKRQGERSCERVKLDTTDKVFALQTLVYADREKTEAAIVEVLVGLSCVCRYQQGGYLRKPMPLH